MKRLEWLAGALLALFLVLGLGVALIVFAGAPAGNQAASANGAALSAYHLALPVAQAWAADAALVNGRASWQEGEDFSLGQAGWAFIFYSPGRAATALVTVGDDQASLLSSRPLDQAPPLIAPGSWNIDSGEAAQLLLHNGGSGFIHNHAGATLTLILSAANGQAAWEGTFITRETRRALYIRLDAGNGAVLDVRQSE
jgi:hypothetical protein